MEKKKEFPGNTGALPLSADILVKANIGLWAIERDEGQPPRMYADDTMLGLLGLKERITPEETYHAWYDHIDEAVRGLVAESMEKMGNGERAEVQYSWRHPDGRTINVRCGGVRNSAYTAGIRIEGTLQNVTEILRDGEDLRRQILEQQTISDGLAREYHTVWLVDGFGEHRMHLFRSNGMKPVSGGAQPGPDDDSYDSVVVVYIRANVHEDDQERLIEATRFETVVRETPESGTYVVSYRRYNSDRSDFDYHQMCFAKAAAADGTVHYILAFRDADKAIREQMAQRERLKENTEIISGLASEYVALYYINLKDDSFRVCSVDGDRIADTRQLLSTEKEAFSLLRKFVESPAVHPDDRALFADLTKEGLRSRLAGSKKFSLRFRRDYGQGYLWSVMDVIKYEAADEEANAIAIGFAERDREIRREMKASEAEEARRIIDSIIRDYTTAYAVNMRDDTYRIIKSKDDIANRYGGEKSFLTAFRNYVSGDVLRTTGRRFPRRETMRSLPIS